MASDVSSNVDSGEASGTQYGGYEFEFVQGMDGNLDDMFMCKICHLPSRNAYLSVCCGHTFCKSCLDEIKHGRTSCAKVCPVCRDKKFSAFRNKQVDRKIRSLRVFCINKKKGCDWQGELNDINGHLSDGCMYESIGCTNGCGKTLQRQCLTQHTATECSHRKINCPHCNLSGIHQFVTGDHMRECPKVVIPCPNHCETDNILREDMDEHRKVCSLEVVSCKYMKLGCGTRMARNEVEKHGKEKMEEHLCMTTERLEKLESVVAQLVWFSQLTSKAASDSTVNIAPVIFRITGFTDKRSARARWYSTSFYTMNEGYDVYAEVLFADSYLMVYIALGDNDDDDDLSWPFRGRFNVAILNQINDDNHYLRKIFFDDQCSDDVAGRYASYPWGYTKFITYDFLCKTSTTRQYVKDDIMYIKVSYYGLGT